MFVLFCFALFSLRKKSTEEHYAMVEYEIGVTGSDSWSGSALLRSVNLLMPGNLSGPLFARQHTINGSPNFHVSVSMLQFYKIFIEMLIYTIFFLEALKNMKEA